MHRIKTAVSIFALALVLVAAPVHAAGLTESQIQAILGLLTSFNVSQTVLSNVEVALRGGTPSIPATAPASGSACLFATGITATLSSGSTDAATGGQVTLLQKFLALDPSLYPEGLVTGYFGPATVRAVGHFQAKSGVISSDSSTASGYGIVGSQTRFALWRGCPNAPSPAPTSGAPVVPGASPTVELHFGGPFVQPGQPATLYWTSTNATSCTLDDGTTKTSVAPNGSTKVYPSGVSSYKISCMNDSDPYNIRIYAQTLTASSTAQ